MNHVQAVLFDYSGTLFRLEEEDSWFKGIKVDEHEIDGHVQAELMRRLTAPVGQHVDMTPEAYHAWVNRSNAVCKIAFILIDAHDPLVKKG